MAKVKSNNNIVTGMLWQLYLYC